MAVKKSGYLSADAFLAMPETDIIDVDVPELGGKLAVRPLTKAQQIAVRRQAIRGDRTDERLLEGLILVNGIVNPDTGDTIFGPEHIDRLFAKPAGVIDRLLGQIMQLSGMNRDAVKEAEEDMKS